MLIICPKCFAQYQVDETKFKEELQVFQCSACGNRFEERVHFDDEENNQNTIQPPVITPLEAVHHPVLETQLTASTDTISMDFSPQSSAVLPEEFRPVSEMPPSRGRKIFYFLVMMIIFTLVGICAYVWLNRTALLKQYPQVQKALTLLTASSSSQMSDEALKNGTILYPVTSENQKDITVNQLPEIDETQVLSVPEKQFEVPPVVQADIETKQPQHSGANQIKDRILPVEGEGINTVQKQAQKPSVMFDATQGDVKEAGSGDGEKAAAMPISAPAQAPTLSSDTRSDVSVADSEEEIILEEIPLAMVADGVVATHSELVFDGIDATKVKVHDVSFKYDQENATAPRLFVQGVVSNLTGEKLKMPPLQVQLFDANGTVLGVRDLPYAQTVLERYGEEFFFYDLSDVPTGLVSKINVTVKENR